MCRTLWIFILSALLVGCTTTIQPGVVSTEAPAGLLTPYLTPTLRGTSTPDLSLANVPSATPTLRVHTVVAGEVLSYIAGMYGVTVPAIVAANPGLNQDVLSVGQKINIPAPKPGGTGSGAGMPTPTPAPVEAGTPNCLRVLDGGAWCFLPIRNGMGNLIENVSAVITLSGGGGQSVVQTGFAILDVIPAGITLPIAVYIPAPIPAPFTASAVVSTGLIVPTGDSRYLVNHIESLLIGIQPDGRSAQVSGEVRLDGESVSPSHVWVALVAYNEAGKIVGVRRLEYTTALSFSGWVYSQGDAIVRVEVVAEVRK